MRKLRPWLWIPAQWAHEVSPWALKALGTFRQYKTLSWSSFQWRNLEFTNPLGLAAGVDKRGSNIHDWWTMGPGFLELGTVTPRRQSSNPGKIMDRDLKNQALWNKMGFPSDGLEPFKKQLQKIHRPHFTPLFVNLGKNRETSNKHAVDDYKYLAEELKDVADTLVINVSSPNTSGLRELESATHCANIVVEVKKSSRNPSNGGPPVLLKLSPDMSPSEFRDTIDASFEAGVDGWILTNTTTHRDSNSIFSKEGGVSGGPLASQSRAALKICIDHLGARRKGKLIVSCGGVLSPSDVFERLEMGADLVQVYSALIFQGPKFFHDVATASQSWKLQMTKL